MTTLLNSLEPDSENVDGEMRGPQKDKWAICETGYNNKLQERQQNDSKKKVTTKNGNLNTKSEQYLWLKEIRQFRIWK